MWGSGGGEEVGIGSVEGWRGLVRSSKALTREEVLDMELL